MKKNFVYAMMSAIALSGAVSFSACSSSEEIVDNPDYNPEKNAVKTQFTISFPNNVVKTRQSASTVQAAQTIASFRGMEHIVLYPFVAEGAVNTDPIASTAQKLGDAIALTSMIKPTETDLSTSPNTIPVGALTEASNSVLYNNVSIPVGTGSFLFYGKAIDATGGNFVNGSLTMTGTEPSSIGFSPVQIYPSSTTASSTGAALATYLSTIARAANWKGCADDANKDETWYNSGLGDLYTKFKSLKAGSSKTAQAAVQDLYTTIMNNTDAVSVAIKAAITNTTYVSSSAGGTLEFTAAIGNTAATNYPGDVNLPDGAAKLSFDDSTTPTFTQVINGTGNTGDVVAKFTDYVYPASLYYYCNSGIKTSNSSQKGLYDGNKTWTEITGGYTSGTAVSPSTRSVAILDPIQYGVGRLDATVTTGATTLYDKKGEAYDATAGFTITGILIGGQKPVKYDFTTRTDAISPETSVPEYTIYDNITKSQSSTLTATTSGSGVNYTLALETIKDQIVYVAVELVNTGADFEGIDGVVPAGCKFYLVAELDPTAATTGYNATTMNQVFKQDYKTIVRFTIPAGSPNTTTGFTENTTGLGKAYNTIPDLRAPELELGLSVNLEWQPGLEFDVNF